MDSDQIMTCFEFLPSLRSWSKYANTATAEGILCLLLFVFVADRFARLLAPRPRFPPEPPGWPVIGHFFDLGPLPHISLANLARKYGPLMSLRLGTVRTVVVSSPEMAREFLHTQDKVFSSRPHTIPSELFTYNRRDLALAPMDETWRFLRKITSHLIFNTTRMEAFREYRKQELLGTLQRLLERGRAGELVDMDLSLMELAFNYITRMLFNKSFYHQKQDVHSDIISSEEANRFDRAMRDYMNVGFYLVGEFFPFLRRFDIGGGEAKLRKLFRDFDHLLTGIVGDRREEMASEVQNHGPHDTVHIQGDDLLAQLLSLQDSSCRGQLTDIQVKALLQNLIAGGTSVPATTMAWTTSEIMRNPEVLGRLQEELDRVVGKERLVSESDLDHLTYLQAVVKESLRLHTPTPLLVPHSSLAATKVAGYDIPEGARVLINVSAICRDPQIWEDASTFNPDRFISSDVDYRGKSFEYFPFGSGRRMCPGISVSIIMVKFTIAQLFHACDFSLPPGMNPQDINMEERFAMDLSRSNPIKLHVRPRLPSSVYTAAGLVF